MENDEKKKKDTQRRTQVKDMPQPEKELTTEEQKRVKGGGVGGGTQWPAFGAEQVGGAGGGSGTTDTGGETGQQGVGHLIRIIE